MWQNRFSATNLWISINSDPLLSVENVCRGQKSNVYVEYKFLINF